MGIARTLISVLVSIVELLLSLRFIFKFFAVNTHTPFVAWIYNATTSLVKPFVGILPSLDLGGFVIDFATLIALVVYVLAGYLVLQIFPRIDSQY
ncbi:MAG: YggT family protein [Parcubacteria group bacterium]|jgi:uncharacterized protein YggT (Ycf19 family)